MANFRTPRPLYISMQTRNISALVTSPKISVVRQNPVRPVGDDPVIVP